MTFQKNSKEAVNRRISLNIWKLQQELKALEESENAERYAGMSEVCAPNLFRDDTSSFLGNKSNCMTSHSNFAQENYFVLDQYNDLVMQSHILDENGQPKKKRRSRFEEENNFRKEQDRHKDILSTEIDSKAHTLKDNANMSINSCGSLGFLPSRGNNTIMLNSSMTSQTLSAFSNQKSSLYSNQPNLGNMNRSEC